MKKVEILAKEFSNYDSSLSLMFDDSQLQTKTTPKHELKVGDRVIAHYPPYYGGGSAGIFFTASVTSVDAENGTADVAYSDGDTATNMSAHEMYFARDASDYIIYMEGGEIVESANEKPLEMMTPAELEVIKEAKAAKVQAEKEAKTRKLEMEVAKAARERKKKRGGRRKK